MYAMVLLTLAKSNNTVDIKMYPLKLKTNHLEKMLYMVTKYFWLDVTNEIVLVNIKGLVL